MKILIATLIANFVIQLLIFKKVKKMSQTADEIKTLIAGINDSTNNIAADLERIAGTVTGGISESEATEIKDQLQLAADKLKAVADINKAEGEEGVAQETSSTEANDTVTQ